MKPELRKDRGPRKGPRMPPAAPRSLEPLSPETEAGKMRAHLKPAPDRVAQTGKRVRAQGTAAAEPTRASNQEGRAPRPPARPPPTGGPATA